MEHLKNNLKIEEKNLFTFKKNNLKSRDILDPTVTTITTTKTTTTSFIGSK